jgi:hypothetical protein
MILSIETQYLNLEIGPALYFWAIIPLLIAMNSTEGHFSLEEWADFARGTLEPEHREKMQDHLDQGCRACAKIVDLWRSVLDIGRREKKFEPMDSDLGWAKTIYVAFPPGAARGLKLLIARLAASGRPALAGIRGSRSDRSPSHFMYQKDDVVLDLEFRVNATTVSMVGQILDATTHKSQFGHRNVRLIREEGMLAQTTTNEFGEFRMDYGLQQNLLLVIELEDESFLITPLPHSTDL